VLQSHIISPGLTTFVFLIEEILNAVEGTNRA